MAWMSNNTKHSDLVDVASFLAGVKTQLSDLTHKVVEGSNLRPQNIDVLKVAKEFDQSRGVPVPGATTVTVNTNQPIQIPVPAQLQHHNLLPEENPNQLTFSFDKKYTLDDIFSKIDDTYRKISSLEKEVRELKLALEEKKSQLK
jgi:hypothetical protein